MSPAFFCASWGTGLLAGPYWTYYFPKLLPEEFPDKSIALKTGKVISFLGDAYITLQDTEKQLVASKHGFDF